jgi:predicted nucleic acid-binding Zn ribbon protein
MEHKPTFIYVCTGCGHKQEINMSAKTIPLKCPQCDAANPKFRAEQNETEGKK